ncbi:MiaB/RimO family radical SAM methylthiotransferase [Enorma phocaeensis]|uniref:MiaB/RimO family radical SAM methylthiotransferase n=1 Tax=Enorma phocaeensis TaxID=1871019 RepID=A0ABT7V698_9ACTN|nr:MiaB/RimO family radical SAM methylthiotransferase [Enorma phocaeensis]MDM8273904.1 MiaB/RimO family radical SAM methylthiotransferase [Enorma phocaeensis]
MANPFVSVVNLGCRVNRVESDRLTCELTQAGFTLVDPDEAELIVINTCAVTGEAEAKTRKAVRHALARPREPYVVATGCAASLHPEMLRDLSDRVSVEPSKVRVVERVCSLLGYEHDDDVESVDVGEVLGHARLGVKVQDGCNNRCTYCIVWKARGPERSVPVDAVLAQVRAAEEAGIPEVVLTGVNLGAYDGTRSGDEHVEIDELLEIVLASTTIPQVRLSSIEPMDVSDRLLATMAEHADRVAPFLHLPVQSGCTDTLRRMARPYTAEDFFGLARRIRDYLPHASLSCDVIVGFPGETDEEFEASRALCENVGFSRMHVFRYSARPGTPAAAMPDQVAPEVMAERSRIMRDLSSRLALADKRLRVGRRERVVLESGRMGTTGSFHRAAVADAPFDAAPAIVWADIMGIDDSGVLVCRMARDRGC